MPEYNKQFSTKSAIYMAINSLWTDINKFDFYDIKHFMLFLKHEH